MNYAIVGGAGFIGSYVAEDLLGDESTEKLLIYDNFSSGKLWHLEKIAGDPRVEIINGDVYDKKLQAVMSQADEVVMLAANPDIARAVKEPDIDFRQGTVLVQLVLEAMRLEGVRRLIYASGSGVYGEAGSLRVSESYAPMHPISTYGASKLGCEALICSYAYMFGMRASCFRFGNVVGGRQTHGVAYDFLLSLSKDTTSLRVLGDGTQSKPYVHISDVVSAIKVVRDNQIEAFDAYNVAPSDHASVNEIIEITLNVLDIPSTECTLHYTGGSRGWKGDVPIVRLDTSKVERLGWVCRLGSREAIRMAISEMHKNIHRLKS